MIVDRVIEKEVEKIVSEDIPVEFRPRAPRDEDKEEVPVPVYIEKEIPVYIDKIVEISVDKEVL